MECWRNLVERAITRTGAAVLGAVLAAGAWQAPAAADSFDPAAEIVALEIAALALRQRELEETWPQVPEGPSLSLGGTDERVPVIRRRLAVPGDSTLFDEEVETAVRQFQTRHGLEPDGVVGNRTRSVLNVTMAQRVRQIELNIRRWRAMPAAMAPRFVMVNVPFMELQGVAGGKVEFATRVVVGTPKWQTPVLRTEIQAAVFLPYWHVPASIIRDEIMPKRDADPDYLAKNRMEMVGDSPWAIRQQPGPGNALGLVKFDMPNRHDVYLHDTPQKRLFSRARRDFSHGCVRVQNPDMLAAWLMADMPQWNLDAVRTAMTRTSPMRVRLATPVPVTLAYITARRAADGVVEFREDVYGLDAAGAIGYPEASVPCENGCQQS